MSRDKGNRAAGWVAGYLQSWWPLAVKTPNGCNGEDIENTPGISFEVKTEITWRSKWLSQALRNSRGKPAFVIYLPPGCGEKNVADALVITTLSRIMPVLSEAGYAPEPSGGMPVTKS